MLLFLSKPLHIIYTDIWHYYSINVGICSSFIHEHKRSFKYYYVVILLLLMCQTVYIIASLREIAGLLWKQWMSSFGVNYVQFCSLLKPLDLVWKSSKVRQFVGILTRQLSTQMIPVECWLAVYSLWSFWTTSLVLTATCHARRERKNVVLHCYNSFSQWDVLLLLDWFHIVAFL